MKNMADGKSFDNKYSRLAGCLAALVLYNLLLTSAVGYGAYYTIRRLESLTKANSDLQGEINLLNAARYKISEEESSWEPNRKREVISSGNEIPTIEKLVKASVAKEWTQLSSKLPSYGGATYVRWGNIRCSTNSERIYYGQMAGPNRTSNGGGVNYQCLPKYVRYFTNPKVSPYYSDLMYVMYGPREDKSRFPSQGVPCAVCEAKQRLTLLMIPGYVRCPTSDWVLEYKGYLMSSPTKYRNGTSLDEGFLRDSFTCVDVDAQSTTQYAITSGDVGSVLYMVNSFQEKDKALPCVVCSK